MKQCSRMYIRKHARPRGADGRFLPDRELWTRPDGESRWVHRLTPKDAEPMRTLFDSIVAGLIALVVR